MLHSYHYPPCCEDPKELPIKFTNSFDMSSSHSFEVSAASVMLSEATTVMTVHGEIDDNHTGDYYTTIKIKYCVIKNC